ncbi:Rossmann-like and DUF2520 domain-containing protein [Cumulibacter soli]|uniref:Rossmann-like and DUF2520 domain-containing protein n=1 Tax=Cumulibacter soli TaxID=2546344 RepID=UPI001ABAC94D|nr:Rossmann-like and DUF2520 domain-containing protein [Cumulibacter soli]
MNGPESALPVTSPLAIVGAGRLGHALTAALGASGLEVLGPFGRGYDGADDRPAVVLLCVPDREIEAAASALHPRESMLVGHCSGATTLAPIGPHEGFSLHPLMTVPRTGARFAGAAAAVAGRTPRALRTATDLAGLLGMTAVQVPDGDRIAYHAAAAVASNQLLAVLDLSAQLASSVGVERKYLGPIVHATVDNWLATGAARALTGPVVRGDEQTLHGHREAVRERVADDASLFDALLEATRRLAASASSEQPPADTRE